MNLCLFLLASSLVFAADWDAVQRIPVAQRIEVTERSGAAGCGRLWCQPVRTRSWCVKPPASALFRADIRELRVFDSGRSVHRGLVWTLVGAGRHVSVARVRVTIRRNMCHLV
jgi:hypothetical protein